MISAAQLTEVKFPGELSNQAILLSLHHPSFRRRSIVIPNEVERSVDEIANQFLLPSGAEFTGLPSGFCHAQEDLALNPASGTGFGVVKGDHVGWSGMLQVRRVQASHRAG